MRFFTLLCVGLLCSAPLFSQTKYNNKFPSPESATYDNNGNDLVNFIHAQKELLQSHGNAVNASSNNSWGYVLIKNVKSPSISKEGVLNFTDLFDINLLMYKSKESAKATWWAREYNLPKTPMIYKSVAMAKQAEIDIVKYNDIFNELATKEMTVVEYIGNITRGADYPSLLQNYFFINTTSIKSPDDYKAIVAFYQGFLNHFTKVNDPVIDDKSFVTFFPIGENHYIGYFNIVAGKLAGKVELITAEFERDRIKLINDIYPKLDGRRIYIYADDAWGMDKMIYNKALKENRRAIVWKTNETKKYNNEL